MKIVFYVVTVL